MTEQRPFALGDVVVFYDSRRRRRMQVLKEGRVFDAPPGGAVRHEDVVGLPEGSVVYTNTGKPILCLRPTLEEYILSIPRQTQVIFPKDLGLLIMRANLFPGARVLESGVGSGAASLALLRAVGPTGQLISYERRPDFAELARRNARRFLGEDPPNWRVEPRDVYEGIDERELDAVLLDVPEPHRAVASAAKALRLGGVLVCWLPTTNQVQELVLALHREPKLALDETSELLLRGWHVSARSVRPDHRMVAHTGFLISARRVVGGTGVPRQTQGVEADPAVQAEPAAVEPGEGAEVPGPAGADDAADVGSVVGAAERPGAGDEGRKKSGAK